MLALSDGALGGGSMKNFVKRFYFGIVCVVVFLGLNGASNASPEGGISSTVYTGDHPFPFGDHPFPVGDHPFPLVKPGYVVGHVDGDTVLIHFDHETTVYRGILKVLERSWL
jgi:hypothetical protein